MQRERKNTKHLVTDHFFGSLSGRIRHVETAKSKNTTPPISVMIFGEMRWATKRPLTTANPVHKP